jgi:hypothetical protein
MFAAFGEIAAGTRHPLFPAYRRVAEWRDCAQDFGLLLTTRPNGERDLTARKFAKAACARAGVNRGALDARSSVVNST